MTVRKLIGILALLLPVAGAAQILDIVVTGIAQPTPVAVVPFGWEGDAPDMPLDVAQVITDDLFRSGRFAPIAMRCCSRCST